MKLHEYKAKWIRELALYEPKSDREKELVDILVNKLNTLRMMTMSNFAFILYQIIWNENVSEEFKELCRNMLRDTGDIKEE